MPNEQIVTPQIPFEEWKEKAIELYGKDRNQWKFKCPSCGGIQTCQDFIDHKIEEPDTKFHFSCIGRWVKGRGCDWTLGGLFRIHKLEVIDPEGNKHSVFEFADEIDINKEVDKADVDQG